MPSLGVFGDAGLGLLELRHHPRIEQTRHVEEGIVERPQPDHGRDIIRFGEYRDLRLGFIDVREKILRRRREILLDAGLRRLQDVAILIDQHGARQIARLRTCRQQLTKRSAILVEQRAGVGDIVGHPQNIAADQLRVFVGIGAGDNQRVLDHFARRPREQPIKTAIDGHVGDDGYHDGRQHRNHREQADDLDVESRRRPAAAAGLHHQPDFADDDPDQEQDGGGVDEQERADHFARRLDPRQPRQHHEGKERRQQRQADRERRQHLPQGPPLGFGERRVERCGRGVCAGHSGMLML